MTTTPSLRKQLHISERAHMPTPVISKEQIRREATAAARRWTDINDACPYPWHSEAGQLFKSIFNEQKQALALTNTAHTATKGIAA